MKTHTLRTACVAIAGVGCITWIAFSAPPPIPPSSGLPAGWHWTGEAAICDPPPCIAAWNDRNNWSWLSEPQTAPPPPGYPVNAADDVYMTWSDATPLVVELPLDSRENPPPEPTVWTIDSLKVQGDRYGSAQSVTFTSVPRSAGNTLECDHAAFMAIDGTFTFTVTDGATVQTVY